VPPSPTPWCQLQRNFMRSSARPRLMLAFTVQPIMFVLLLDYVFGGAIPKPPATATSTSCSLSTRADDWSFGGFVTEMGIARGTYAKGLIETLTGDEEGPLRRPSRARTL